jgi:hypothetical protein
MISINYETSGTINITRTSSIGTTYGLLAEIRTFGPAPNFSAQQITSPWFQNLFTITNNVAPSNISLSNNTIPENSPVGTTIGTLSTTDTNGDTHTYSLVGGDISAFNIDGNLLRSSVLFDFETKSEYSIQIRSTDQGGLFKDVNFTIYISNVNDGPGTIYNPYTITSGKVSEALTTLSSGSTFYFTEPYSSITQESTLYKNTPNNTYLGATASALGTIAYDSPLVSIVSGGSNINIVFSSITDPSNSLIFVVFDNSGNIVSNLPTSGSGSIIIDIFLTVNKPIISVLSNGINAGTGSRQSAIPGQSTDKTRYRVQLLRGDGFISITPQDSNPNAGSDPHITTIFGKKYDFHPSTRKTYTLLKTKEINITSHFTGLKKGVFYDRVSIDFPNKEKLEVDFNKQKIRGNSKFMEVNEIKQDIGIRYNNMTQDKSVENIFQPKSLTKLSFIGENPIDLYVDYKTRYVHFRFPGSLPMINEMSGLVVEQATRLD